MTSKHNNSISITECFDEMVDCFLQNLRDNLMSPLDYIGEAMNRVRISTGWLPLITVLNEDIRNMNDNLNHIIGYMGIPYIQAKNGIYHASTVQKKLNEVSVDVLELNAQEAVFLYLMGKRPFGAVLCIICVKVENLKKLNVLMHHGKEMNAALL